MIASFRGFRFPDARAFYADNEARRMKVIFVAAGYASLYHARLEIAQRVSMAFLIMTYLPVDHATLIFSDVKKPVLFASGFLCVNWLMPVSVMEYCLLSFFFLASRLDSGPLADAFNDGKLT